MGVQTATSQGPSPPGESPPPACLWYVPVLIDCTVHLCLQLVGTSADRSAVSSSPQGSVVISKVLQREEGWGWCIPLIPAHWETEGEHDVVRRCYGKAVMGQNSSPHPTLDPQFPNTVIRSSQNAQG